MSILFGGLIVVIQLLDAYLRYLPFSAGMTEEEIKTLRRRFIICAVLSCALYSFLFLHYGITPTLYKRILIFGWVHWLIIFVTTVHRAITQHIFVFGMVSVWGLIIHNFAAIILVVTFDDALDILFNHAIIYPILFILFLPLAKNYFFKLLPPKRFFDEYGKLTAFMPFIMCFGVLLLWAQEPLIHSWQERFSRFYLPFVFIMFHRHIFRVAEQLQDQRRVDQNLRMIKAQIIALGEYNRLIQENNEKVSIMRHDLRHTFRLIYAMIQQEKFEEAKEYLRKEEKSLAETSVKSFCKQPLVNSALSIHISRAKQLGIDIKYRISLPDKISTDENDLALLICNLIENALHSAEKQAPDKKTVSIIFQNLDKQFVLEVSNFCAEKIVFDEQNYPYTSEEGHGLGIASIKIFQEKYNAYVDFSQVADVFKVTMYWQG
jgi:signal transduction histidine kinase